MTIGPPQASILPFSVQQVTAASQREQREDNAAQGKKSAGFGDILATLQEEGTDANGAPLSDERMAEIAAAFGALEHGLAIQSAQHAYTLKVHIGDNALAFQARPIVGATGLGAIENLAFAAEAPGPSIAATPDLGTAARDLRAALDGIQIEPDFQLRSSDARSDAARTNRAAINTAALTPAVPQTGARPAATQGLQSTQRGPDSLQTRLDATREPGQARSAQATQHLQSRAQLFAQLVAAATEYRVAVRGAQLSQADHDRLVADIRAALRSYGLADLPITLSADTGAG